MSSYTVEFQKNFSEEAVYEWFINNKKQHKIEDDPIGFIRNLVVISQDYVKFSQCKNIDGTQNNYLKNIKYLQGKYSQHFVLLLAGRSLDKDLFIKLCHQIENLLFVYTITRSTRKDINMIRNFSQWSVELRKIKTSEEMEQFISTHIHKELKSLSRDFDLAFSELTEPNIARFRMRYILGKLCQFVDESAYNSSRPLDEYFDKSITIEHILPQSKNVEFDKDDEYDTYVKKTRKFSSFRKNYKLFHF
jgi:hypothetical protein